MTTLYLTDNFNLYDKAKRLSLRHICHPIDILKTKNGKPYFEGDELFLSLSHSKNIGAIALSTLPVGVDMEVFQGREHPALLSRFCEKEQREIECERDFLIHWTAREAFVKLRGDRLADIYRHLDFYGGKLYLNGREQQCNINFYAFDGGVACLCGGDKNFTVENLI